MTVTAFRTYNSWVIVLPVWVGLLSMILPVRWLQLSGSPKFYERSGAKFIRKFVQDGDWAKRFARERNSEHRIIKDKATAMKYAGTVKMYDKYHFLCFEFFSLTSIYAVANNRTELAIFIWVANIIYKCLPCFSAAVHHGRGGKDCLKGDEYPVISRYPGQNV